MSSANFQELYERMFLIRKLEDRLQRYCDEGIAGDLHFNKGQEAIAVGVCSALRGSDKIVTHHRTIAHQIAKMPEVTFARLRSLVAELLGKETGVNGGRAGEMHISDKSIGHEFAFQLVGTCIPVGAGLAWALKNFKKTDDVVAIFFGDAAVANGQFHEGVNLIGIHRLPVLLVCENNGRAGNILPEHYTPEDEFGLISPRARAMAYGIKGELINGNDVEAAAAIASGMLHEVRRGRPRFLECHTHRLSWHKQGQRDVRTAEELEAASVREPLRNVPDGIKLDGEAVDRILDEVFESVAADRPPGY
jgi:pyruvate dehydrogenase E1 component alpha subunit